MSVSSGSGGISRSFESEREPHETVRREALNREKREFHAHVSAFQARTEEKSAPQKLASLGAFLVKNQQFSQVPEFQKLEKEFIREVKKLIVTTKKWSLERTQSLRASIRSLMQLGKVDRLFRFVQKSNLSKTTKKQVLGSSKGALRQIAKRAPHDYERFSVLVARFAQTISNPAKKPRRAWLEGIQEKVEVMQGVGELARGVHEAVEHETHVPKGVTIPVQGTRLLSGVSGLASLVNFFRSLFRAASKPTAEEKAKAAKSAVLEGGEVVASVGDVTGGLHGIGAISESQASWAAPLGYVALPLQLISLKTSVTQTYKVNQIRTRFNKVIPKEIEGRLKEQAKAVGDALKFVAEEKGLRRKLTLSKECPIKEKAAAIMKRLKSQNAAQKRRAIREGNELLQQLKGRVHKHLGVHVARTALTIAGIALSIFSLATPPGLAVFVAGAVISLIGLGVMAYKKKYLNAIL